MVAVDMTSIYFYRPPPAVSPHPSLKPPSLGNAGGKRTATIQRDSLDNLFKTNREMEPPLQSKLTGDTKAGDGENSERAGNNRDGGGGDSDTNNKEDLCLPSIEPFGSSQNLSSEADENTSLPLEKIAQTLSDDDFLDIDGFLRPVWEMPNPTLPTDDEPMSATAIPEICDSPKRETQGERSDSIVIDDTDADRTDINDHDLPPLKKHRGPEKATLQPVFKVPPGLGLYYNRALQDHENTASSNRSSEVGGSQDNPFVVQDDDIKTGDEGTSVEIGSNLSEINTADTQLNIPCSTKEPKTHHCSDPNATAEPFDRLCSLSVSPFEDQERRTVHANDHNGRTSATVGFASATATRPFAPEQSQGQGGRAEAEEQEWEVIKILDKRETRSGTEYKVRWKSTWLPRSELGSTRRLLREYEAESRAQHGRKRGRPVHKDKVW